MAFLSIQQKDEQQLFCIKKVWFGCKVYKIFDRAMGKIPVKIKAVVYGLSPYQQKVMPGLWKDLANKLTHKVTDNWINTLLLVGPVVGTYTYVFSFHRLCFSFSIIYVQQSLLQKSTQNGKTEPLYRVRILIPLKQNVGSHPVLIRITGFKF